MVHDNSTFTLILLIVVHNDKAFLWMFKIDYIDYTIVMTLLKRSLILSLILFLFLLFLYAYKYW
jgi:hypothetical protein